MPGQIVVLRAVALAADRAGQGGQGVGGGAVQVQHGVGHRVGSQVGGGQAGQIHLHQQHPALGQERFHRQRQAQGHDFPGDGGVKTEEVLEVDVVGGVAQKPEYRQRHAQRPRHDVGKARARHAHAQAVDEQQAQQQVGYVDHDGEQQAGARVAQAAEDIEDGVEHRKGNEGYRHHAHVAHRVFDQDRLHVGVNQMHQRIGEQNQHRAQPDRHPAAQAHGLPDGPADLLLVSPALGPGHHDGPARRQRHEHQRHQAVHRAHHGHRGNGRFADGGHQRCRKQADEADEKLVERQGDEHLPEFGIGKVARGQKRIQALAQCLHGYPPNR